MQLVEEVAGSTDGIGAHEGFASQPIVGVEQQQRQRFFDNAGVVGGFCADVAGTQRNRQWLPGDGPTMINKGERRVNAIATLVRPIPAALSGRAVTRVAFRATISGQLASTP